MLRVCVCALYGCKPIHLQDMYTYKSCYQILEVSSLLLENSKSVGQCIDIKIMQKSRKKKLKNVVESRKYNFAETMQTFCCSGGPLFAGTRVV